MRIPILKHKLIIAFLSSNLTLVAKSYAEELIDAWWVIICPMLSPFYDISMSMLKGDANLTITFKPDEGTGLLGAMTDLEWRSKIDIFLQNDKNVDINTLTHEVGHSLGLRHYFSDEACSNPMLLTIAKNVRIR